MNGVRPLIKCRLEETNIVTSRHETAIASSTSRSIQVSSNETAQKKENLIDHTNEWISKINETKTSDTIYANTPGKNTSSKSTTIELKIDGKEGTYYLITYTGKLSKQTQKEHITKILSIKGTSKQFPVSLVEEDRVIYMHQSKSMLSAIRANREKSFVLLPNNA